MHTLPLLSLLIFSPILGGILLLLLPDKKNHTIRNFAFFFALLCLLICGLLIYYFEPATAEMQWTEHHAWIEALGINYHLGIDGFSLPLITLTCMMTILVILASVHSVKARLNSYLANFLIMQGLMCGAFAALDAILFYIFWEALLIPMFLIIGLFGAENRIYATLKFFLYTFLGSVFLLVGLIYLHFQAKTSGIDTSETFNILIFQQLPLDLETQKWLFIALLIGFAVKIPMWPVHTWLPDAHVEAPTGGSVILAAILLKLGGYGFLRFLLPITPDAASAFAIPMISLSLIAIVYIALVALVQKDMKKLIAYSSISHMGFVTLGFFVGFLMTATEQPASHAILGISGGMVQMISHGFVSAALFLCVGVLYDRLHSRQIQDYSGVVNAMPIFASFFVLFALANVGLPGTSGFVGEFMVILSAFQAHWIYAFLAASILVLGASYTLWMVKRVVFGTLQNQERADLPDLLPTEKWVFILLAVFVILLGVWPEPLVQLMQGSTDHLVQQMMRTKL